MQQVKAKKALGQHFLTDLSIAERIADSISSHRDLPVLEIGPGMGVLTQFLLEKGYDTHVIEIDTESVAYLKIPIEDYFPGDAPFALIGNYPYNISSQIFFRMLDYRERIPCCAGMLQREVAQRLASPPGNKDYGILSVLLQAWYDVEYLFTVDEHVFNPPPKVKSGVIRLIRNERTDLGCSEALFKQVIKTGFNQRRKTLRNSLKALFGADYTGYTAVIFSKRPEQLGVEDFVTLTRLLEEHQAKAAAKA